MKSIPFWLGICAASSVHEHAGLAFDWDSQIQNPGLQENNVTSEIGGCVQACAILQHLLPQREFNPGETAYYKEKSFFWSQQQFEVSPQCFVQPSSAKEVATILNAVRQSQCPFAVKSGGHAAFAGASNVGGGITIDLSLFDEVTVSADRQTTRVGAGNRWDTVYSVLDPLKVSVVGGRVSEVGVGGLLLGGGLSFFAGRHGWGLDNIRNYELVTANSEILNVNLESYPDLYWALRGGGNNFGIVTRFDLETFEQGPIWGGCLMVSMAHNDSVTQHFIDFTAHASEDIDAQAYTGWVYTRGRWVTFAQLTHVQPTEKVATSDNEWPAIFVNLSTVPMLRSTLRMSNMTDLARELNSTSPNGKRNTYWTWTLGVDASLMDFCLRVFADEVASIQDVPGMLTALVFQQVSAAVIQRFARNGGNSLGIVDGDGPLLLTNLNFAWLDAADDEAVFAAARRMLERSVAEAKRRGLHHRYLYQNYAAAEQRVFEGYGEHSVRRLREVSRKYDPEQIFQRLQPGYFKLYWDGDEDPGR